MSCGIIKFLLPPSAIHSGVYCNFFNKREKCLVVAGLNFIQVYRLNVLYSGSFEEQRDVSMTDVSSLPAVEKLSIAPTSPDADDDDLYAPSSSQQAPKATALELELEVCLLVFSVNMLD